MSATLSTPAPTSTALATPTARALRPSFVGLVRGELLKVARQWATWILAALVLVMLAAFYFISASGGDIKGNLQGRPQVELYRLMGGSFFILQVFTGIVMIIITARLIGMEYSYGTVRIVLARGVSRLQLLGAQLAAVVLVAAGLLAAALVVDLGLATLTVRLVAGTTSFSALDSAFWADTWTYVGFLALNLGVTILMATALSSIGRGLAFGVSAALAFFPVDNFSVVFALLVNRMTHSNLWLLATGDLLGPNLNHMTAVILPHHPELAAFRTGFAPLTPVTGGHALLVAGIWSALFVVIAVGCTWLRDVKE